MVTKEEIINYVKDEFIAKIRHAADTDDDNELLDRLGFHIKDDGDYIIWHTSIINVHCSKNLEAKIAYNKIKPIE